MFFVKNSIKILLGLLVITTLIGATGDERLLQEALQLEKEADKYHQQDNNYSDALKKFQKSLLIRENILGKNNPATAASYNNISMVYRSMGDYPKALEYQQKALSIAENVLGKNHPHTATSYLNIGNVYNSMGNYPKALEYQKKSLFVRKNLLGEEHYNTAIVYSSIGETYQGMGNYPKALEYQQKSLVIYQKMFGEEHPSIAISYSNIGSVYDLMGDYPKGLMYKNKGGGILEKIFGKEHLLTAASYNNIGSTYKLMNQYPESLEYYQKALMVRKKILGDEHPDTAISYHNIGDIYSSMGNYPKALEYDKKSLIIQEKVLGENHPDIAKSYNSIGDTYGSMSDHNKALEYKKKSLAILEKLLGEDHPATATTYANIGATYGFIGNNLKALEYQKKALVIRERVLGKEHPSTALLYTSIGGTYDFLEEHKKALQYHQMALAIQEKILGKEHYETATSYNNIGSTYAFMGDSFKALEYEKKSLAILEKVLGKNHPTTAKGYSNITSTYADIGNVIKAYEYAKKAFTAFIHNRDNDFSVLDLRQKEQYLKANDYAIGLLLFSFNDYHQNLLENKKLKQASKLTQTTFNDWIIYKGSILDDENRLLSFAQTSLDPVIQQQYKKLIELKISYAKMTQSLSRTSVGFYSASESRSVCVRGSAGDAKQYGCGGAGLVRGLKRPKKRTEQQAKLQQKAKKISKLEYDIARKDLRFKKEKELKIATTDTLRRRLSPKALYLDYGKVADRYFVFTLSRTDMTFNLLKAEESKKIDAGVANFRKQIKAIVDGIEFRGLNRHETSGNFNDDSRKILTELYTLIFPEQVQRQLADKSQLIISSDGVLRLLPFEALYNTQSQQYLVQQKNVQYIASGRELMRVFTRQSSKTSSKVDRAVLFSYPDFDQANIKPTMQRVINSVTDNSQSLVDVRNSFSGFVEELPGTKIEAQQIQRILKNLNVQSFSRTEANEQNLLKTRETDILHIATHGFFNTNSPNPMLQSGILLAGANHSIKNKTDAGIVTALKLSGLILEGTDLVVLSACETGTVNPNSTEGVNGLTKAFIQAGAQKVIMSLWSVADKETAFLMTEFYNNSQGISNAYTNSLRQSKIKMINEGRHPYYWAAFILYGL